MNIVDTNEIGKILPFKIPSQKEMLERVEKYKKYLAVLSEEELCLELEQLTLSLNESSLDDEQFFKAVTFLKQMKVRLNPNSVWGATIQSMENALTKRKESLEDISY